MYKPSCEDTWVEGRRDHSLEIEGCRAGQTQGVDDEHLNTGDQVDRDRNRDKAEIENGRQSKEEDSRAEQNGAAGCGADQSISTAAPHSVVQQLSATVIQVVRQC